jgi:multidrug efflux pump subunit AcrA (membrane-fusion protein)
MSDDVEVVEQRPSNAVIAGIAGSAVLALGGLLWCFGLSNHLAVAEKQLADAQQKNVELTEKQETLAARLRATTETLGQSVGMTQKQIELKTQRIMADQAAEAAAVKAQSAQTAKLEQQQQDTTKQVATVATDVSAVKTDVTGAKSSIAETQQDLASTKEQLQRTIGDAGVMSGLIARNHDELETLKHKGDRSYFEFTLQKGAKPTLLSTVKLQAKKVDEKHSKYTLVVSSDDKNIEKKDKSLDEPVQFYSGKDPALFEIVVNVISKNQISGYLSTPKGAPGNPEAAK